MAAKENQGLQIALITFVILTIVLSVSTYLLFSNWKESEKKTADAVTKANDAAAKQTVAEKGIGDLKTVIGATSGDDPTKIQSDVINTINSNYGALGLAALPDDQKNLLKVVEALTATIKSKYTDVDSRDKDIKQLKGQLSEDAKKAAAKLKEVEAARDAAVDTLDKQTKAYNAAVDALKNLKDQLVQDKTAKDQELVDLKASYERKMTDLRAQLVRATKDVVAVKDELKKYSHLDPSATGGYVTWINQRGNMAYINLGWEDGLHRRITFSVYPPGTTDVAKAVAKGKIEVVNVTGPHLAEARIIENPTNNPLLPGDLIHTEGWHPGQHEHFGVAGYVDIDGSSGPDQTRRLHDLILANGGIVDAEIVEIKGENGKPDLKPKGEITVNTRYLIMGEMLADKPAVAERAQHSAQLIKAADQLGVEKIGLQKFLEMMGYTARSAAAGGAAAPVGSAEAGGDDNGFRPRRPPARGKDDGAF